MCFSLYFNWIVILPRILLEIFTIEDPVREVRFYQHIDIKIYIGERFAVKAGRHVDVAIKPLQVQISIAKTEDVVPTIEPIILSTESAYWYCPKQIVFNVLFELSIEHYQRINLLNKSS